MMSRLIPFMVLLVFSCTQKHDHKANNAALNKVNTDSLRSVLNEIHEKGLINGFGVAIVNQDGVLYSDGIGFANKEEGIKYTNQSIQNIGSVSKTFIGISLLKAQEMGLINLDDPVNKHLSYEVIHPKYPEIPITIKHLATHTSGITDTEVYELLSYILKADSTGEGGILGRTENFNPPSEDMPMQTFLREVLSKEGKWYREDGFTDDEPGALFEYTNIGATLAAAVLEEASGKTFKQFCTEHILEPLGMNSSGWSFEDVDFSQHSVLYANPSDRIAYYKLITYPDGGMITSSDDLGKYLSELIKGYNGNGTLLSADSYAELFTEQLTEENIPWRDKEDDFDDEYNSGIFMGFSPKGYVGHTGGDPGIASYMFFDPKTNIGKLLMINTSVSTQEGVDEFYDIWYALDSFESYYEGLN